MKATLSLIMVLALLATPCAAQEEAEWYNVNGVSFVEAVGAGESFLLITHDSAQGWRILAPSDEFAPGMVIERIGSAQVMVSRNGGQEKSAAPILRQQIPADVLITAICRLYRKNLFVFGEMSQMVVFSEGLLNHEKELPGLVDSLGFKFHSGKRAVLIRREALTGALPEIAEAKEAYRFSTTALRGNVADLLADLDRQTRRKYAAAETVGSFRPETRSPRPFGKLRRGASAAPALALDRLGPNGLGVSGRKLGIVTVQSSDLTPEEVAAYLAAGLDTEIVEQKPEPEPKAAPKVTPDKTASASTAADPAVAQAFKKAVSVARTGDYRTATKMLVRIVKARQAVHPKITNLLGKLLWSLGKKDTARKAWKISLKRDPANQFARRALAKTADRS